MRGRLRRRMIAPAGAATLLVLLAIAGVDGARPIHAYVSAPKGVRVLIEDAPHQCSIGFCYTPADAEVAGGATVTWFNNTASPHSVTRCTPAACGGAGPGDGPDGLTDSGPLANGATYFFTFSRAGHYTYYCTVYGYRVMHGSVTVHDAGPRSTPSPAQPFGIPLPTLPPLPAIPRGGAGPSQRAA